MTRSVLGDWKERLRLLRLHVADRFGSAYETAFVRPVESCPYFSNRPESFGILLKGKSLEQLPKYDDRFTDCFLVNNFDEELKKVGDALVGKQCVHFVNRLQTAWLTPENYRTLSMQHVQLPKVSCFGDAQLRQAVRHYHSLGLQTHYLPKHLLRFNNVFDRQYAKKCPNTGLLAIMYALEMLRPRNLWIMGLDFYQADYLVRRPHQNPLDVQQEKMKRIRAVEVTQSVFMQYPETQIHLVTYVKDFPETPNVTVLTGNGKQY